MDSQTTNHLSFPSSSSSAPRWSYDVFLSFRGEDNRNTFADHLYKALIEAEVHTFRDDDELPRGNDISSELLKAIEESKISIVVFSKDYASSRWCLDELLAILDCRRTKGQFVIPVFYHVDPSDLRKQSGSYEAAFASHEQRFDREKVNKWRAALCEAADLAGWPIDNSKGEAEFVEQIVEVVLPKVNCELFVGEHLIGLGPRIEHLKSLLKSGPNGVCVVGIYGMGGIGKTTLAKAFFNEFIHQFESHSFIENVRELSKESSGLVHLQEQLLSELKGKNHKVPIVDRGKFLIKERLSRRRVLIVLDDLDQKRQLDSLIGSRSVFGEGSLIILTTRDELLLNQFGVDVKYEVQELDHEESLMLFSWHAFKSLVPSEIYVEISEEIVRYTCGLPLAIEVLGSSLVKKTKEEWKSMLDKLKVIPPSEVQQKLRISFDALDDCTKDIFLDIACFLDGMGTEEAIKIFDGCGFYGRIGISTLKDRCLLKGGCWLGMHDLLKQMGRHIVREEFPKEPGMHSRLWQPDHVHDVLTNDEGTKFIEGISVDTSLQMRYTTRPFAKMPNLRLLRLRSVYLDGSFEGLFKNLRWLSWRNYPMEHLPDFHPRNLVSLNMERSKLHTLWMIPKPFNDLKILYLPCSKSLKTTPDFTGMPDLEELRLEGCESLSDIHSSIGVLNRLKVLNLQFCTNLKTLPNSIGHLTSLTELNVHDCRGLEQLPEQLGNLKSLVKLDVSDTRITCFPESVMNLAQLKQLYLVNCKSLTATPDFTGMPNLKGCKNLKTLPNNIGHLTSLAYLYASGCTDLEQLPEQLGNLKSLVELDVSDTRITCFPESVMNLAQLRRLFLKNCKSLTATPDFTGMPNLEDLGLVGCWSLSDIHSSIGVLSQLTYLKFMGCKNLKTLPNSIGHLTSLTGLNVHGCRDLEQLPEQLGNLKSLVELDVSNTRITCLPESVMNLAQLRRLFLKNCKSLTATPDFTGMPNLEDLGLEGCESLSDIHSSIGVLSRLTGLDFSGCTNLKTLPNSIGHLTSLTYLYAFGCTDLEQLPEQLGNLKSLVKLDVSDTRITCFPESVMETNLWRHLKFLVLNNCSRLIEIQGLENLQSINLIDLRGCTSLSSAFLNLLFQGHSGLPSCCHIVVSKEQISHLFEYQWVEGSNLMSFGPPFDVSYHHLLCCHKPRFDYVTIKKYNLKWIVVNNITSPNLREAVMSIQLKQLTPRPNALKYWMKSQTQPSPEIKARLHTLWIILERVHLLNEAFLATSSSPTVPRCRPPTSVAESVDPLLGR